MARTYANSLNGKNMMRTWIVPTLVAAVVTVAPAAAAQGAVVALWHMDETSGDTMVDSASVVGGANNGRIVNVTTGAPGLASGRAYTFNGTTSYVEVADNASLDPGTAPIALRATVRTVNGPMPDDSYDLVRKGVVTTKGGYWKMEIKRSSNTSVGRLHCVFKGMTSNGMQIAKRLATPDIVDGLTHTVQCLRSGSTVTAVVDGTSYTTTKATGSIANNQPVIVGSKLAGDDVLRGSLDEVSVSIG